ncbi:reverse transcriptase domain-containing protein [Tanacetum coccineum]
MHFAGIYIGTKNDINSMDLLQQGIARSSTTICMNPVLFFTKLQIVRWRNYKHLDWIIVRRDDDKLYKFKEGGFNRLRIQDIKDMLLFLVQGKLTNLTVEERLVFNNKDKKNKLMCIDELYKYSDGTLNDVRTALNDRLRGIQMNLLIRQVLGNKSIALSLKNDMPSRTLLDPFQIPYLKRKLTMEEMVNKFINEGRREHDEMEAFIKEFRTTNELLLKERNNSLCELGFELNIPFTEALAQMPKYAKFLKSLLSNKTRLEEACTVTMNEKCSAVLLNKLPLKQKDLGSFTIPCDIGNLHLDNALADLGASISLMPYLMYEKLGLDEPKPTRISLELADMSIQYPRGIAENVLIKVDKFVLSIDFVILDMREDTRILIILGRPFLATARAMRDVFNKRITLRVGDEEPVCIDYRKLNDATRKDHFPLPFIDQMLERLSENEFYCFLDGFSGFFQIPIALEDQEKTTFTCPYGTFAYRRMPFGLYNAPATFQRCKIVIFHDMVEDFMEVFMDDFSVFGNSFNHCLGNLDKMLARCEETNLVLNWEKFHFMGNEGIVLGHKISRKGIEVDRAKIDVIAKLPYPTNVKGVRSFLGHAGFYRRFIKDFSMISKPMTQLLMKDARFNFSDSCKKAFNDLKEKLTSAPIIISPNWNIPFELMCDASDFAVNEARDPVMSSSSTVTYTSVYTDSEPGRVFWRVDEELSDGGSLRVIVYGYDGLLMQPVASPSPDYVPGPEHPPSPDYVPNPEHPPSHVEVPYIPEPESPEYLVPFDARAPLEDQPLPVDASPIALSPCYVADSDLEEDPEEDHVDYPADGGDDDDEPSDDDNDDDDTDDGDEEPFEDEDDDEEEEHLALADSSAIPVVDPVPSAGGTEAFKTDESTPTPRSPHIRIPFCSDTSP